MEIILNAGLGIGALMFLLILFKREKKPEDLLFLAWISISLLQITFYQITLYRFSLFGFWAVASFGLPLLGAPLLFLYIFALTGHKLTLKILLQHLSIYFLYSIGLFLLVQTNHIALIASDGYLPVPLGAPIWMQYYAVPLAISGFLYFVWDIVLLRRHRKNIVSIFSFDEKINLKWVGYVVYCNLGLFVIASFLIFGAIHFQLFSLENAFASVGILLSMMLIAFGFYGFQQTSIFSNMDTNFVSLEKIKVETASYAKSGLTEETINEYGKNLEDIMRQKKPFLDEDLTLNTLANHCGLGQTQLSQIINQHFQMNFYDFVNRYRVEEAKQKLTSSDYDHLSVLGIAFDCGFKSKSSFNRYFKKHTGSSPSDFKKK